MVREAALGVARNNPLCNKLRTTKALEGLLVCSQIQQAQSRSDMQVLREGHLQKGYFQSFYARILLHPNVLVKRWNREGLWILHFYLGCLPSHKDRPIEDSMIADFTDAAPDTASVHRICLSDDIHLADQSLAHRYENNYQRAACQ